VSNELKNYTEYSVSTAPKVVFNSAEFEVLTAVTTKELSSGM
jgi:hypothetical protein